MCAGPSKLIAASRASPSTA
ncbi:hypothetical protein GQ600_850 [Phytophthora cactorum]|nr:hypothetical protein GQ600_850 [Phytophthora cactorum]